MLKQWESPFLLHVPKSPSMSQDFTSNLTIYWQRHRSKGCSFPVAAAGLAGQLGLSTCRERNALHSGRPGTVLYKVVEVEEA